MPGRDTGAEPQAAETWETAELAKLKAKGNAPKGDDWKARYKEPEPVDAKGLPALPRGWCWASIDELCPGDAPAVYGIILPGDDVPSGVPYVRPVDMRDDGTVDFDSIKRTTTEIAGQYVRASLRTGDVVLSIVGTIGKVVIVTPELSGGNITQSSARIRPPVGMAPEYMALALKSPTLTRQFDTFRFGNAVQRLNVEHVRRLGIPLAPKDEQAAIVQRAESALGSVPGVLLAKLKEQLAVLDRAVLAKAFRGELVPQDPNDEPAEVMLARVRAEAEGDDAPKSKRARKTADGRR
jgi:type I restriction enzyme S subunit